MTSSTNCNRWCGYMKGGLPERGPALPILMVISSSESGNEGSPAFSLASLDSGGRAKAIWGSEPTPCGWEKNDKTRKGQESCLKIFSTGNSLFYGSHRYLQIEWKEIEGACVYAFKFRSTLTAADQTGAVNRVGLASLSFINLTAAVIRGGDLHCRVFMYRNVDCRLDGWVKQAHDFNTKEHYLWMQSNQSKLSFSWEIWIWKPSQICMATLLGHNELLTPRFSIPHCALRNVYTAIGPTSVPYRGC